MRFKIQYRMVQSGLWGVMGCDGGGGGGQRTRAVICKNFRRSEVTQVVTRLYLGFILFYPSLALVMMMIIKEHSVLDFNEVILSCFGHSFVCLFSVFSLSYLNLCFRK